MRARRGARQAGRWLAAFACVLAGLAHAEQGAEAEFDIAPQALSTALTQYAEQAHIQVVTAATDLGELKSAGVSGRLPTLEALARLLSGSALRFQLVGKDTVVVLDERPAPPDSELPLLDTIVIVGKGYTRATNTVTPQDFGAQAAGVPVQFYLNSLPGVNAQLSDPYGLYEFGSSLRIRGFGNEQIGTSLDGVPLESYDLREGSPPSRYLDGENLSELKIAQGSGDVTMPSYHALGGSLRYFSSEPLGVWNTQSSLVTGSDDLTRLFARLDTPAWWPGGPMAYLSGSRTRGVQFDNRKASMAVDHLSVRVREDFAKGSLSLGYRYGNRDDHDMQNYQANGQVSPTFDLLENMSGDPERDALYYDLWTNGRRDQLWSLQTRYEPKPGLTLEAVPYFEDKRGYGYAGIAPSVAEQLYQDAMDASPQRSDIEAYDGSGVTERKETLRGLRRGLTASLGWRLGAHALQLGGWLEQFDFSQRRPIFNVDDEGRIELSEKPIALYYDRHHDTGVRQFYAKDTLSFFEERLSLAAGFKGLYVARRFEGIANSQAFNEQRQERIRRIDKDYFQPQLGGTLKLGEHEELFTNYAENFSAVPRNAMGSVSYDPTLRAERSRNIDLGLRSLRGRYSASLSGYYIDYRNRILQLTVSNPFLVGEDVYQNVGGIHTYGLELANYWNPHPSWRLGSSLSLNRSRFRNDYQSYDVITQQEVLLPVRGKTLPDTPKVMASADLLYRHQGFSAGATLKYTGLRYSVTSDAESVPAYTLADLSAAYELEGGVHWGKLRFQLNVYNALDKFYIGYIEPSDRVDAQSQGNFFRGAPRSVYFSLSSEWR
ncbi:TonB-dependent receptor domain-containing protein [Solimonas aquatica]|nr:TonB-dependent receptor [Solimonas aquatica]